MPSQRCKQKNLCMKCLPHVLAKIKKGVQSRNFKLQKHSNLANRNQALEAKVSSKEKLKELSCCRVHACSSYHYTN